MFGYCGRIRNESIALNHATRTNAEVNHCRSADIIAPYAKMLWIRTLNPPLIITKQFYILVANPTQKYVATLMYQS